MIPIDVNCLKRAVGKREKYCLLFTEEDSHVSHNYSFKCNEQLYFEPRSGKTLHFPIKTYSNLNFRVEDNTQFHHSTPYTYFSQKFKMILHFLDMLTDNSNKRSCVAGGRLRWQRVFNPTGSYDNQGPS